MATDFQLFYKYVIWTHDINAYNNDWSESSFVKICSISCLSEFWKFFNNFDKLDAFLNKITQVQEDFMKILKRRDLSNRLRKLEF